VSEQERRVHVADVNAEIRAAWGQSGEGRERKTRAEDRVPAPGIPVPVEQVVANLFAVSGPEGEIAEAEEHIRSALHDHTLKVQLVGHPLVVRVEEGYQGKARFTDP
jgi:hypothetical protein